MTQAQAYFKYIGQPFKYCHTAAEYFSFAQSREQSTGAINVRLPLADTYFYEFRASVIVADIPLLVGLDILDKLKLVVNNVNNSLDSSDGWTLPLVRKFGHIYLEWSSGMLYTLPELRKLHKHFFHPSPARLFSLMQQAGDPHATSETMTNLSSVSAECDACQRISKAPQSFTVAMPNENLVFNHRVLIDLMFLKSDGPVLHIVGKETLFNAAVFVSDEKATTAWAAFILALVSPYLGYPEEIHTDRGPQFTSTEWISVVQLAGIKHVLSGVQSHNSLGTGETYHSVLRQIYERGRVSHPNLDKAQALAMTVMAINCTVGQRGMSPTILVFGAVPRYPTSDAIENLDQRERMKVLQHARALMARRTAKARTATGLSSKPPAAANSPPPVGSQVLCYRELPEDIWTGPFLLLSMDGKTATLQEPSGHPKTVSIDKIKQYRTSQIQDESERGDNRSTRASLQDEFESIVDSIAKKGKEKDAPPAQVDSILFTEIISANDRAKTTAFELAKKKEISGLFQRGTFHVLAERSHPKKSNRISGRFVLTLKNVDTADQHEKARYVAQGYNDTDKAFVVHNSSAFRQSSTKVIVSLAAILEFRLFSHDVTQAYIQAEDKVTRDIYLKPKSLDMYLFPMTETDILKIEKQLYDLRDSGDYWHVTFDRHLRDDLKMTPTAGDLSLYIKRTEGAIGQQGKRHGLLGSYVDDGLLAGDAEFETASEATLMKFQSKPRTYDNVTFLGVDINTVTDTSDGKPYFSISQPDHMSKLEPIPEDISIEKFRSDRACVAWLGHSRPDLGCAINRSAQVTPLSFGKTSLKELNRAIHNTFKHKEATLIYRPLDLERLTLRVYTYASFANNNDKSSQLGFIILLCDDHHNCHFLSWQSRKSRRVVRSIMAGETYAFADGFDAAFILKHNLQAILSKKVPLAMLTDSKQVFDVITKASQPTEKRLMIDVEAVREAYNRFEIDNVGLVSAENNLADGLTKPGFLPKSMQTISEGKDVLDVKQWIVR